MVFLFQLDAIETHLSVILTFMYIDNPSGWEKKKKKPYGSCIHTVGQTRA